MALEIIIGEEYKIKIESGNKFKGSIFEDLYLKASKNVEEIIIQSDLKNTSELSDDVYNNIIAFTGDRGTGKSSSMISFAEAMVNKEKIEHKLFFEENKDSFSNLLKKNISSLPIIDPSLFKGDDKLFEIVVSKMFAKFQEYLKKNKEIDNQRKRELISQFQEVYSNLRVIHEGRQVLYKKEVIEALSDLAYGTNLKSSFFKLINLYLELVENESDFLIIAIDDFDLNINGAYDMMEDIRQFLIQKKIILLLSCKIDQLLDSLNHEVIKSYDKIINSNSSQYVNLSEDINIKSLRYLDKLIPLERRLNTPVLTSYNMYEKELLIYDDFDYDKNAVNICFNKSREIQNAFREVILKKNLHFSSKTKGEINLLVPNNIRNLSNSISFLLKDATKDGFKKFLLKEIKDNLPNEFFRFFESLESLPNHLINQYIVNWIGELTSTGYRLKSIERTIADDKSKSLIIRGNRRIEDGNLRSSGLNSILEASVYYNVSYGDVNYIIHELEKNSTLSDVTSKLFVVYLKNYYSYRILLPEKNKLQNLEVFLNGRQTLVQEFPFNGIDFFPAEKSSSGKRREEYKINYKPVDLRNYLFENTNKLEIEQLEIYYWLTFFFTYIGTTENSRFRKESSDVIKNTISKLGNPYQSVTFNSIAFLNNILYPNLVLKRFFNESEMEKVKTTCFFENLNQWVKDVQDSKQSLDNYFLIFNLDFFNEFLNELYVLTSESKVPFDTFGERLYTYIPVNFNLIVESLNKKYDYFDIDFSFIITNPFIKFWIENNSEISTVLTKIHGLTNSNEISSEILVKYIKSKTSSLQRAKNTSTALKRYINELQKEKLINSSNKVIFDKIFEYYIQLRKSKNDLSIKDNLIDYIKNLSSNG